MEETWESLEQKKLAKLQWSKLTFDQKKGKKCFEMLGIAFGTMIVISNKKISKWTANLVELVRTSGL